MNSPQTLPVSLRLRAAIVALIVPLLLCIMSFGRLAGILGRTKTGNRTTLSDDLDPILAAWVTRFQVRLRGIWRFTCLKRAAVLFYILRHFGRPVEMWIGVKHNDSGSIAAHAWLVCNGAPYLETDPDHPSLYKVLARFPETS